jgi:hypothetical protein
MFQDQGEVLAVKVAGEPAGITAGAPMQKQPWLVASGSLADRMVKLDNRQAVPGPVHRS